MSLSFCEKLLKWGYSEGNGPSTWSKWFTIAEEGRRQSPIDIDTTSSQVSFYFPIKNWFVPQVDPCLGPLLAVYSGASKCKLENTGKSFQVHFHDPDISSLTGGPLTGEYKVGGERASQPHSLTEKYPR